MRSTSFLFMLSLMAASFHANADEYELIHATTKTFTEAYVCTEENQARTVFDAVMKIVRSQAGGELDSSCKFSDGFTADVFLVESWDGADWGVKINMWKTATSPPSFIVESFNVPSR